MTTPPASRKGYTFSALSYAIIGACQDVRRQLRDTLHGNRLPARVGDQLE